MYKRQMSRMHKHTQKFNPIHLTIILLTKATKLEKQLSIMLLTKATKFEKSNTNQWFHTKVDRRGGEREREREPISIDAGIARHITHTSHYNTHRPGPNIWHNTMSCITHTHLSHIHIYHDTYPPIYISQYHTYHNIDTHTPSYIQNHNITNNNHADTQHTHNKITHIPTFTTCTFDIQPPIWYTPYMHTT